jgi:anaerobic dimethyl sulfoxide reductase subunit A
MTVQTPKAYDRVVRTVCSPNCLGTCGVKAYVRDERIVKLEPAAFPDPGFERICGRGISMATQRLHHPDRLTHPLVREGKRGEGKWRKVTWDEAYEYITERQTANAEKHGWRTNAWLSGSGNYGFRAGNSAAKVAHTLEGTLFTYFAICGDFAGMMGYHATLGSFANSNDISEVKGAQYFLSIGKNVADTAHSDMHFLFDAMENGTKFVMVDPRFSRGAAKADEWIAPRPGTDTALALGMINVIINEGLVKEDYLLQHTNAAFLINRETGRVLREKDLFPGGGNEAMVWDLATDGPCPLSRATRPALAGEWQLTGVDGMVDCGTAYSQSVAVWQQYTPEYAATICDVPADQIRHTAIEYATSDPAWIWLGLGPQRYSHGHTVARAWITLATLCGNIGKPYAGVSIYDAANLAMVINPHTEWLQPEGRSAHSLPGTQVVDIIASGDPYPVKTLWLHAYGFATQTPFYKRFIEEALPELDLFVVSEQMMTPAAQIADVVLPVVSYYEDDWDLVGGGENWYMQLRRRAIEPVGESRNDYSIFQELCERYGKGEGWNISPEEDCKRILATHPDARIRAVDWETLKRDGVARVDVERPYTPFRDMKFNTASGRIEIYQEQFVDIGEEVLVHKEQAESRRSEKARTYPFTLITYKDVHSTHSQHFNLPYIREMVPEPRLDICPDDAATRGIQDGDEVTVFNDRGEFSLKATVNNSVLPGTVALPQGWLQGRFIDGHPSDLGHVPSNAAQDRMVETNYPAWDILCNVRRRDSDNDN